MCINQARRTREAKRRRAAADEELEEAEVDLQLRREVTAEATRKRETSQAKLKAFNKYEDTTEALASATAMVESKLDKGLKSFLKKSISGLRAALAPGSG